MSQSAMSVGCPHCGTASAVELATTDGAERPDEERLKGRRVDCQHCGDDFSFYYY
ncbi:hypothetical protein [Haladaptatus cibarius]|uniref:hypothetical protein n=1 Tax=Haladaptatus cibarius TaxID=453847 RepID=UPI000ADE4EC6|nr:hypothetical protein [Haladaptatus cibarius]